MTYSHREGCSCEECWRTVYVSPPREPWAAPEVRRAIPGSAEHPDAAIRLADQ
jgi:hypothetical protein